MRKFGQFFRDIVTAADLSQNQPSGLSTDVADHQTNLHVHRLKQPSDPVEHSIPLRLQVRPAPGQVAQFPNGCWRNEAALQQPVLQEFGNPLAILLVHL